jgi:hypothetical protein
MPYSSPMRLRICAAPGSGPASRTSTKFLRMVREACEQLHKRVGFGKGFVNHVAIALYVS